MSRSSENKRQFYARPEVASAYETLRFGGASGAWVNAREIELALALASPFRRVLDVGCGTGRLTRVLAAQGTSFGLDSSRAMLDQARENCALPWVEGDAFALPFAAASFDTVVAMRLVFHFADAEPLLREMTRVLVPRGVMVFDTILWSARAWLPLDRARWGDGVFVHSASQIERVAQRLGLEIARREPRFLFSPYIYRRLPFPVVRVLERVERKVPGRARARVFWKLVRSN